MRDILPLQQIASLFCALAYLFRAHLEYIIYVL